MSAAYFRGGFIRPYGTGSLCAVYPAINRWAIDISSLAGRNRRPNFIHAHFSASRFVGRLQYPADRKMSCNGVQSVQQYRGEGSAFLIFEILMSSKMTCETVWRKVFEKFPEFRRIGGVNAYLS
jgi:hypothetical protein